MATNNVVGATLELNAPSVGNVRKQLKEATADLIAMQQKFGETSKEALEAAKRVAGLKDRIQEARETADLFDPGNKFKAIGNAVGSIAQGFTAVQGAMGLMGVESKEVEKQLLRVQSAMALSQGLSGIADSAKNFARLGSIIKTQVVTAFSTLRGAIAATGIGLLISGVALLIENFDAVKKVIYDTFPALKGLFDNFDRIKQIARGVGEVIMKWVAGPAKAIIKLVKGDFKGAVDELKGMFDVAKNFREGEQKEIKAQEAERAAADAERLKKEKEKNDKLAAERKRAADAAAKQREAEKKKEEEELKRKEEERKKIQEAADKVLDDARRAKLTEQQRAEEDSIRKFEENKKALLAAGIKDFVAIEEQRELELSAIRKKYEDEQAEKDKKANDEKLKNEKEQADRQKKIRENTLNAQRQFNEAMLQAEAALQQRRFEIASAGLDLIGSLAGENEKIANILFGIQKGLEIARIVTETARGIVSAKAGLALVPPFIGALPNPAFIKAAALAAKQIVGLKLSAASSIATITAASIRKFSKGGGNVGGGGGGVVSGGIGGAAPLQANLSPQTQLQLQNQQAINNMGNQSMRAYVLNSDIRNNNQRNAYLQRNSRIG
jgi:hypothetical protein